MILDYLGIIFENFKNRKLRSWLTMLGIFIGIALIVSLISLGQGLEEAIVSQFSSLGADKLIVQNANTGFGPPGAFSISDLTEHDKRVIEKVRGVDVVVGRTLKTARVSFKKKSIFTFIGSYPAGSSQEARVIDEAINLGISEGRNLKGSDKHKAVIGWEFAEKNVFDKKVRVGDKLEVNGLEVDVVGILDDTTNSQLSRAVLMTDEGMRDILNLGKIHSAL